MSKKLLILAAAAVAALAVGTTAASAASASLAQTVVACVADASKCATGSIGLAPGESVTFTKQQLADACKGGGYAVVGTSNQGLCVSFVEHTFPSGATVTVPTSGGGTEGLRSGDGGMIANIYSDGNGGLIANLVSDGNGGLIAN
jgi:hypothetical protein